jgi:hypothetical protein
MPTPLAPRSAADIERLARRRAGAKLGWYVHATVYLMVNLGLVLLSLQHGRAWAAYPLLGWGLGLLVHGFVVFMAIPGGSLYERLLARERRALQPSRDPW